MIERGPDGRLGIELTPRNKIAGREHAAIVVKFTIKVLAIRVE